MPAKCCCRAWPVRCSTGASSIAVLEPIGVLGRIAAAKREELAHRFDGVALDELRAKAEPTTRSLAAALTQPGARFILEIKKASPSAVAIRADADPAALA